MTLLYHSTCGHCGASLKGRRVGTQFCSNACAKSRHNVKMLRGARIHDLLCEWRRSYKNRHKLTEIGQIVKGWIEEDALREQK